MKFASLFKELQERYLAGISGKALSFDGSNDYVSIPDSPSLDISGNQISFEFWMNSAVDLPHPTNPEEATYFFDKGDAYVGSIQMDTGNPTYYGRLTFSLPFSTPDNKYIRSTKDSWKANTWFYIALTYDGNIMRIYVNGGLDNSVQAGGNVHTSSYPLAIGSYSVGTYNFFTGIIDEFAIYNYARTAEDISNYYNSVIQNPQSSIWMQWWFWAIIGLGAIVVVLAFTTVHYRKKPRVSRETNVSQSKTTQRASKVCPRCGATLPADSKFCGKCGTSLE